MFQNLTLIRIGVALVGALACLAGGFLAGQRWVQAEWDEQIAQEAQAELDAERQARETEQQMVAKTQEVQDAYASQARAARVAADGARGDLARLRNVIATGTACPAAGAASGIDAGPNPAGVVVNECATALSTMAEALDDRDARLKALQAWVQATESAHAD